MQDKHVKIKVSHKYENIKSRTLQVQDLRALVKIWMVDKGGKVWIKMTIVPGDQRIIGRTYTIKQIQAYQAIQVSDTVSKWRRKGGGAKDRWEKNININMRTREIKHISKILDIHKKGKIRKNIKA